MESAPGFADALVGGAQVCSMTAARRAPGLAGTGSGTSSATCLVRRAAGGRKRKKAPHPTLRFFSVSKELVITSIVTQRQSLPFSLLLKP